MLSVFIIALCMITYYGMIKGWGLAGWGCLLDCARGQPEHEWLLSGNERQESQGPQLLSAIAAPLGVGIVTEIDCGFVDFD